MEPNLDVEALVKHFRTCDRTAQREILDGVSHEYMRRMNLYSKLAKIYSGCEQ